MNLRAHQGGFTLIEILVSATVFALLSMFMSNAFGPFIEYKNKVETDTRLKQLQTALNSAYAADAQTIDSVAGAVLTFANGATLTNNTAATAAGLAGLAQYAPSAPSVLANDGFNQPFQIFVSNRLSQLVDNTTIYYHVTAFVSKGWNGQLDAGTAFNAATGQLTLAGDDSGGTVDGFAIALAGYKATRARMQKVVDAYQTYFQTRYQSDPARDLSIDYFAATDSAGAASARWDGAGAFPTTGGAAASIGALGAPTVATALGLADTDLRDAWGAYFSLDNSSAAVRNPDNATAALAVPVYSAKASASLPGAVVLELAAIGRN